MVAEELYTVFSVTIFALCVSCELYSVVVFCLCNDMFLLFLWLKLITTITSK